MTTLFDLDIRVARECKDGRTWEEAAQAVIQTALANNEVTYKGLFDTLQELVDNQRFNWLRVSAIGGGLQLPLALHYCRRTDRERIEQIAATVLSYYSTLDPNEQRRPKMTLREMGVRAASKRGNRAPYTILERALEHGVVTYASLYAEMRTIVNLPEFGGFGGWVVTFPAKVQETVPTAVATTMASEHERILCIAAHMLERYRTLEAGRRDGEQFEHPHLTRRWRLFPQLPSWLSLSRWLRRSRPHHR